MGKLKIAKQVNNDASVEYLKGALLKFLAS